MPSDREIDGYDQSQFLYGKQQESAREGFIYWNGDKMYGVKRRNCKLVFIKQTHYTDPALPLGFPYIINLMTDPKEREPFNQKYFHSWTMVHFGRLLKEFEDSVKREPLIPAGAQLDHQPVPPPEDEASR